MPKSIWVTSNRGFRPQRPPSDARRRGWRLTRVVATAACLAVLAVSAAGCGTARPGAGAADPADLRVGNIHGFVRVSTGEAITDSVAAAAVRPPSGPAWYVGQAHEGTGWMIMFFRLREAGDPRLMNETSWVYYSFPHADVAALRAQFPTERALLEAAIADTDLLKVSGPNFTQVSSRTSFRTIDGGERVFFDQSIEERNNPSSPGVTLVIRNVGFAGVNPHDPTQTYYVQCSNRVPQGTAPTVDLDALLEEASAGIRFLPAAKTE